MDKQSQTTPAAATSVVNLDMNNDPFVLRGDQVDYLVVPPGSDQISVRPALSQRLPASPVPSTSAQSRVDDWETHPSLQSSLMFP
jgi:hypothetical protein